LDQGRLFAGMLMDTVINSFVEKSKNILQDNLIGVYLHGSAVMKSYNPLKNGLVLSKKEGGEWALNNIPEKYQSLIKAAMGEYTGHADISYEIIHWHVFVNTGEEMEIREYTEYKEDEIYKLYTEVGWKAYTADMPALKQGYRNSLLVLAAYEDNELLGIIRAVGDGYTIIFIQDILVYPDRQRQGIGTALLKAVLERYPNVRQIELVTDNTEKTIAFYKSMGFSELSETGCCGFMMC
jgi:GNAT superfamily N-acetyltransferase